MFFNFLSIKLLSLKSSNLWNSFNGNPGNGDNSSEFNALPAGNRRDNG